jgi:hypothetical protein
LIQPVARERIDDLTPNTLFEDIEIRRRLRASPARDAGNDGKRS